jgi:hypothetical protein
MSAIASSVFISGPPSVTVPKRRHGYLEETILGRLDPAKRHGLQPTVSETLADGAFVAEGDLVLV